MSSKKRYMKAGIELDSGKWIIKHGKYIGFKEATIDDKLTYLELQIQYCKDLLNRIRKQLGLTEVTL